jgi:hypothetical protein
VRLLEGQVALNNGKGCDGGDASRLPTTSRERSTASTSCGSPTSKRNKRAEKCGCSVTSKIKNHTSAIVNFFALKRGVHGRWEHLCEIDDFLFLIFEVGWCGRSVTSKINNYTSAIVHLLFPAELDMEDMREMED